MIEEKNFENGLNKTYALRPATESDLEFLFRVSTEAMKPVGKALHPDKVFDEEAEFKKYQTKFVPDDIEIVISNGVDVGRLRIVRDGESIYVGGIQILPEFQRQGIGTSIFDDLISESSRTKSPITLEVHDVNLIAVDFYKKIGFQSVGKEVNKILMKFTPSSEGKHV